MKRSCRDGDCLPHQRCQKARGAGLAATESEKEEGLDIGEGNSLSEMYPGDTRRVIIFGGELLCLVAAVLSARMDFREKGGEMIIS